MNDLQRYLKARGITVRALADMTPHYYHSVQKVVRGSRYRKRDGSLRIRSTPAVRESIATTLGLYPDQLWGKDSGAYLRELIQKEIKNRARKHEQRLAEKYLYHGSVSESV